MRGGPRSRGTTSYPSAHVIGTLRIWYIRGRSPVLPYQATSPSLDRRGVHEAPAAPVHSEPIPLWSGVGAGIEVYTPPPNNLSEELGRREPVPASMRPASVANTQIQFTHPPAPYVSCAEAAGNYCFPHPKPLTTFLKHN
jgi:hypothetical protein